MCQRDHHLYNLSPSPPTALRTPLIINALSHHDFSLCIHDLTLASSHRTVYPRSVSICHHSQSPDTHHRTAPKPCTWLLAGRYVIQTFKRKSLPFSDSRLTLCYRQSPRFASSRKCRRCRVSVEHSAWVIHESQGRFWSTHDWTHLYLY